jgi:hypothetical protein
MCNFKPKRMFTALLNAKKQREQHTIATIECKKKPNIFSSWHGFFLPTQVIHVSCRWYSNEVELGLAKQTSEGGHHF